MDLKKGEGAVETRSGVGDDDASQRQSPPPPRVAPQVTREKVTRPRAIVSKDLPILDHRQELLSLVRDNRCCVVIGETGSGKTTQLPQFLLDAGLCEEGRPIVVTQPRRVAAISVAQRVADERGADLGDDVGYHVRFDKRFDEKRVKLKFVTDGVLLREALDDATLRQYSVVILDEAHIRSLETDILFGLLKANLEKDGPKLVIMSATLQAEKFQLFFDCPQYTVPGRLFPIKIKHCDLISKENYSDFVTQCVEVTLQIHKNKPPGDILVFLTGRAEIERACNAIYTLSDQIDYDAEVKDERVDGLMVVPVYGAMTTQNQRKIFDRAPDGIRKIVVATEIASTSLTVDGIVYVVDSGFVKQTMYNPSTGLDALQIVPISRSEASQRAGRAGRTKEGECYRIYDRDFEETEMTEHTKPEIQRSSLASVALTLKCLGIDDILRFDYLDQPEEFHLLEALRQLFFFDAIDRNGKVTAVGHMMSRFPLPPSLARVILHCAIVNMDRALRDDIIAVLAMLSSETPYVRPRGADAAAKAAAIKRRFEEMGGDDFNTALYLIRSAELWSKRGDIRAWCKENFLHLRVMTSALRVYSQLAELADRLPKRDVQKARECVSDVVIAQGNRGSADSSSSAKSNAIDPTSSTSNTSGGVRSANSQLRWRPGDWRIVTSARGRARGRSGYRAEDDLLLGPVDELTRDEVRKALSFGLFHNIARRAEDQNYFRTMEGHATCVLAHPSSCFFQSVEDLDWVIFHQVVWTSKPYMHVITPIKYAWVKHLLPKLRKIDIRSLSSSGKLSSLAKVELAAEERREREELRLQGRHGGPGDESDTGKRKNSSVDVDAARARFLARKKKKKATPL